MGELIVVLLAVGLGVVTAKAKASTRSRPLEEALAPFGIRRIPTSLFSFRSVLYEGRADGVRLIVETLLRFVDSRGNSLAHISPSDRAETLRVHFVRIILDLEGAIPKDFAIHIHFGHDFNVLGDEAIAAALLDGDLLAVMGRGDELWVEDGRVTFESPFLVERDPRRGVLSLARMAKRLIELLSKRVQLSELLEENLRSDPDPGVRARAVAMLLSAGGPRADILEPALEDGDPEVRLAAARHMGEAGFDVIAEIVNTEILHETTQHRALRYLVRSFPLDRIAPILVRALNGGSEQIQATAIQLVSESCPSLAKDLPQVKPVSYFNAARLAEALGASGAPGAEQALIQLLYHRPDRGRLLDLDMRIAIADALGRVGSVAAIRHLYPYTVPPIHDDGLRIAAETAIEIIRGRSEGGAGGALSLFETEDDGKLSVTREPGSLSIDEE